MKTKILRTGAIQKGWPKVSPQKTKVASYDKTKILTRVASYDKTKNLMTRVPYDMENKTLRTRVIKKGLAEVQPSLVKSSTI